MQHDGIEENQELISKRESVQSNVFPMTPTAPAIENEALLKISADTEAVLRPEGDIPNKGETVSKETAEMTGVNNLSALEPQKTSSETHQQEAAVDLSNLATAQNHEKFITQEEKNSIIAACKDAGIDAKADIDKIIDDYTGFAYANQRDLNVAALGFGDKFDQFVKFESMHATKDHAESLKFVAGALKDVIKAGTASTAANVAVAATLDSSAANDEKPAKEMTQAQKDARAAAYEQGQADGGGNQAPAGAMSILANGLIQALRGGPSPKPAAPVAPGQGIGDWEDVRPSSTERLGTLKESVQALAAVPNDAPDDVKLAAKTTFENSLSGVQSAFAAEASKLNEQHMLGKMTPEAVTKKMEETAEKIQTGFNEMLNSAEVKGNPEIEKQLTEASEKIKTTIAKIMEAIKNMMETLKGALKMGGGPKPG
jgi:hypothetical protein